MNAENMNQTLWRIPWRAWAAMVVILLTLIFQFYGSLEFMVRLWQNKEEYSHGFLIPLVVFYLIWQKRDELESIPFCGAWTGFLVVLVGLAGFFIGELSSLYIIIQYSFLIVIYGLFLAFMGWTGFKKVLVPLLILVFMIPLPNFLYNNISSQLQLISSQLGVFFIRLFGISVYLEGNVIDLGTMQLQVVEACNGLRYLFPLMTLGFILAYFYRESMWKRVLLFLSSIPITVAMNSLRIGLIGITVEYWGIVAAEGVLHDFEGWIIFMSSLALMLLEAWVLWRIGKNRQPFRMILSLQAPAATPANAEIKQRKLPLPFMVAGALILCTSIVYAVLPERQEIIPPREYFSTFPLGFDGWRGAPDKLERIYIESLRLDDYLLADYVKDNSQRVNFYIAYYDSQRKGASAHSPKSCIPGGGWRIRSIERRELALPDIGDRLAFNRVHIQKDDVSQLVYYWFQQRGRIITNEYLVKWYMFWDALMHRRTDGALVRVVTQIDRNREIPEADRLLESFIVDVQGKLDNYIPR